MALVALAAAVFAGCGDENGSEARAIVGDVDVQDASWTEGPTDATAERLPCTTADEPANFTVYWLGPEFDGLPLTAVLRRCDKPYPGEPVRANDVALIYGTCEIPPEQTEGGCAPPLKVQTFPACERALADLGRPGPQLGEREGLEKERGVPVSANGAWTEVYTGQETVVIHASRELRAEAMAALVGAPPDVPPADLGDEDASAPPAQLPAPAPGHLEGELSCSN